MTMSRFSCRAMQGPRETGDGKGGGGGGGGAQRDPLIECCHRACRVCGIAWSWSSWSISSASSFSPSYRFFLYRLLPCDPAQGLPQVPPAAAYPLATAINPSLTSLPPAMPPVCPCRPVCPRYQCTSQENGRSPLERCVPTVCTATGLATVLPIPCVTVANLRLPDSLEPFNDSSFQQSQV